MPDDPRAKLDSLRTELGDIDRQILALVARRQAVAQKIGQVKRDAGIPTRDYRQERDVITRARAAAVEHGLTPTMGEELVLALIRGSLTVRNLFDKMPPVDHTNPNFPYYNTYNYNPYGRAIWVEFAAHFGGH